MITIICVAAAIGIVLVALAVALLAIFTPDPRHDYPVALDRVEREMLAHRPSEEPYP
jgi:hypothetical protein